MRKFTPEEEAYFIEKAEEAEKYDKLHGGMSSEEFWTWLDNYEKEYEENRRKEKLKRNIKLNMPNFISKISKRFIRA